MEKRNIDGKVHLIMEDKEFELIKRIITYIPDNLPPEDWDAIDQLQEDLLM